MALPQRTNLKDHRVLALDIGSSFIKVAELRLAHGVITLERIAVAPVPPDSMDKGQIVDPILLGKTIGEMLSTNKFTARKAVVALRGQSSVVVRPIDLPKMSVKELKAAMPFEVERHIPFAADEIVMDYAPFEDPATLPDTEENMKVLLAVAQEDLVKLYLKVLHVAKLTPVALDVEILAAIRALVDIHQSTGSYEQTLALVNIGASSTDISIVSRGNLVFNRSVPLAGDAFTSAIAEQLGYSVEEAEELKKAQGQIFLDSIAGELPVPQAAPSAAPTPDGGGNGAQDATLIWDNTGDGTLPQHIFSLDDEPQGAPPVAAEPSTETAPQPAAMSGGEQAPASDTAHTAPDESAHPPIFTLDAEESTSAVNRPVFDLSSELEEQLPPARSRPVFSLDEPEGAAVTQPPPMPANVPSLEVASAAAPVVSPAPAVADVPSSSADAGLVDASVPSSPTTSQNEVLQRRIFEAMQPILVEIVTEVRRSLEYFTNREPEHPVERILIFGGTSRFPRLAEYLHHEIGVEVESADPLNALDTTPCQLPAEYLQDLAPALPVCIGLGIRDMLA